jgi:hypothetical protein
VRTRRAWTVDEFETVAKELNPYYGQKIADDGHTAVECNCDEPYCQFCQGGLFACSVCGGLEGSVPTHCPGDAMTYKQNEDVYAGRIDYRDGAWVNGVTVAMVHAHVGAILEGRA